MSRIWFKRSGQRTSEKAVRFSKDMYAEAKRTGKMGFLRCSIQPTVADSIDRMSLTEFASWSGQFTWKDKE